MSARGTDLTHRGARRRFAGVDLRADAERQRLSRYASKQDVRLLLGDDRPAQRAHARSLAHAVVLQHRGGRLRAHRVPDRRRARLGHARRGAPSACSRRCASSGSAPQGAAGRTASRAITGSSITSSTWRRATGSRTSSSRRSTPRCCSPARSFCQQYFDRRRCRRARDPRARRFALPRASTGTGPATRPPLVNMGWRRSRGFNAATRTGAATTRR